MPATEWLHHIFDTVEDGWISIFSIDASTGARRVDWARADNPDELEDTIAGLAATSEVWFGCATRTAKLDGGKRGGKADCAQITALWNDIDIAGPNHKTENNLPTTVAEAMQLVHAFPLKPTAVVHSGGGLQAWWKLDEPLDATDAEELLSRWATTWAAYGTKAGWHVDNVFEVARVMRLPGTFNRKNEPTPVTILEADWDRRYGTDDIGAWLLEAPKPQTSELPRAAYIGPERPGDAFNAAVSGNDILRSLGWLEDHTDPRTGDVHWIRPGKAKGAGSSATVYAEDGHTTVYSDSSTLQTVPRRPYDPFGLYVALVHRGDFRAASRELNERGYGERYVDLEDLIGDIRSSPAAAEVTAAASGEAPKSKIQEATEALRAVIQLQAHRAQNGYDFIHGAGEQIEALWGDGDDILWAKGEPCLLVGPSGVGKSTLTQQVVRARIDGGTVLGYPISPATEKILYLAMDRPAQIARSMGRMFGDEWETQLRERITVWRGPLPFSVVRQPEGLAIMCDEFGASTVFVDSIKDLAPKMSDEETGSQINAAFQMAIVDGIEVFGIHHQRKAQGENKKPNKLSDVYGSQMMVNGAGSVMLLWGEAGDPVVEFTHLKQPMETVGPFTVTHDHYRGISSVDDRVDAWQALQDCHKGVDAAYVARAMFGTADPSRSEVEKARRRLEKLVREGRARVEIGEPGTHSRPTMWFPADVIDAVATLVDPHHGLITVFGSEDKTAGQEITASYPQMITASSRDLQNRRSDDHGPDHGSSRSSSRNPPYKGGGCVSSTPDPDFDATTAASEPATPASTDDDPDDW